MGRLERGPYLGDVSALCLLPSLGSSPFPYLIAGTGPQILLFNLESGELLISHHVFDGVRVHGIHAHHDPSCSPGSESTLQATVAVHGERRVKIFELHRHMTSAKLEFVLVQSLPRFFQWVLDVRFLQEGKSVGGEQENLLLAVGLSDNSIVIWDLKRCEPRFCFVCSERCLLYSLRLWGSSIETLRVAAGTIFNKVLIWDLRCWNNKERWQSDSPQFLELNEREENSVPYTCTIKPLQELVGHEGSIYRISWSASGSHIASASDDRSARIWISLSLDSVFFTAGPVLYGHGGRLWDCHIADNLLLTASEDCTSRVWTPGGHPVATLTGHIGRGIWRSVYDEETATLVTAGADSSIKVQSLAKWKNRKESYKQGDDTGQIEYPQSSLLNIEVICISLEGPDVVSGGSSNPMDSNSEYVRSLALAGPRTLYIATNQGHVHHVTLNDKNNLKWTEITKEEVAGPIVCLNLLVDEEGADLTGTASDGNYVQKDDLVAFGNGLGTASALGVQTTGPLPMVIWRCTWLADQERQLLGIFWCKSLGRRFVFTTDPRGLVRVWALVPYTKKETLLEGEVPQLQALLVAVCQSPLHGRVVCLDVCTSGQLLVCGDQRGNLVLFHFPNTLLQQMDIITQDGTQLPLRLQSVSCFKGAHGISAVASVTIASSSNDHAATILSTGRDGCICRFSILTEDVGHQGRSNDQGLMCTGVEDVPAITVVESVQCCHAPNQKIMRRLAAGFTASDFVLWDLTYQSELTRITCGGWRRPHSFVVGNVLEHQFCFAYLKDQVIHVHRQWAPLEIISDLDVPSELGSPDTGRLTSQLPQSLHGQFHGREIHSVHFISSGMRSFLNKPECCSWIATGSEDGAVRITRYGAEGRLEKLESAMVLGEHTGGSAVRAVTLVTLIQINQPHTAQNTVEECTQDPLLLLSVGAKEVLTCWLLEWGNDLNSKNASIDKGNSMTTRSTSHGIVDPIEEIPVMQSLTSKWLTSYTPPRTSHPSKSKEITPKSNYVQDSIEKRSEKPDSEGSMRGVKEDDDLRFLAVTAFSVCCTVTGCMFCFVVTASSNATLRLLALDVNSRAWVEVAVLKYHRVPVLAVQHLIIPTDSTNRGVFGNLYMIVSGATDGSIAVWDVTNLIVTITKRISSGTLNLKHSSEAPLRPRTGRGSQGGRRWRSCKQGLRKNRKSRGRSLNIAETSVVEGNLEDEDVTEPYEGHDARQGAEFTTITADLGGVDVDTKLDLEGEIRNCKGELSHEGGHYEASILYPLHTFTCAHLSGVNCLSVAKAVGGRPSEYVVVSGGDDQSLHVINFTAQLSEEEEQVNNCKPSTGDSQALEGSSLTENLTLEPLSRATILGAHNSAVKGIWTDGSWAFSTGLDQRLRCWHLSSIWSEPPSQSTNGLDNHPENVSSQFIPMAERNQCVIDVPEAEDLHVESDSIGEHYRIAVVGRGLQVLNFFTH